MLCLQNSFVVKVIWKHCMAVEVRRCSRAFMFCRGRCVLQEWSLTQSRRCHTAVVRKIEFQNKSNHLPASVSAYLELLARNSPSWMRPFLRLYTDKSENIPKNTAVRHMHEIDMLCYTNCLLAARNLPVNRSPLCSITFHAGTTRKHEAVNLKCPKTQGFLLALSLLCKIWKKV